MKIIFRVTILTVLSIGSYSCEKTHCTSCGITESPSGISVNKTFCWIINKNQPNLQHDQTEGAFISAVYGAGRMPQYL